MTDQASDSTSAVTRGFDLGLFGALSIAGAIAGLAGWLFLLPPRQPNQLTRPEVRPALLDKPHRHLAAPAASDAPTAH